MSKQFSASEFYHKMQKTNKQAKLNRSPEKKKRDELKVKLLASRNNLNEARKKIIEAQKLIKQLQEQMKRMKEDKRDLEYDNKYLRKYIERKKIYLAFAQAKKNSLPNN